MDLNIGKNKCLKNTYLPCKDSQSRPRPFMAGAALLKLRASGMAQIISFCA